MTPDVPERQLMFLIERIFPVGYLAVRMAVVQGVSLRNLSKKTGMTALHVAAYYGEEGTYWSLFPAFFHHYLENVGINPALKAVLVSTITGENSTNNIVHLLYEIRIQT
jgi:hypothetical protein